MKGLSKGRCDETFAGEDAFIDARVLPKPMSHAI